MHDRTDAIARQFLSLIACLGMIFAAGCVTTEPGIVDNFTPEERSVYTISHVHVTYDDYDTALRQYDIGATSSREEGDPSLPLYALIQQDIVTMLQSRQNSAGPKKAHLNVVLRSFEPSNKIDTLFAYSNDRLHGEVMILDADTGQQLTEFSVDMKWLRSGIQGLVWRSDDVRERMSKDFAKLVGNKMSLDGWEVVNPTKLDQPVYKNGRWVYPTD